MPKNFEVAHRPLCGFEDQTKSGFGNTHKGTFKKYHQLEFDLLIPMNSYLPQLLEYHLITDFTFVFHIFKELVMGNGRAHARFCLPARLFSNAHFAHARRK